MAVIECPHCGTPVEVGDKSKVRAGHNASSTREREWVMRESGNEVHRCPDLQTPSHRRAG
jgi:hypothetical protein